jgi:hypothetical protein
MPSSPERPLTGEKAEPAKRTRLSSEQRQSLPAEIARVLGKGELAFGDLASRLPGIPASAIRAVLKDKKLFRMEGTRGSARYSLK